MKDEQLQEYFELDRQIKDLSARKDSLRQELANAALEEIDEEPDVKHLTLPKSLCPNGDAVANHVWENFPGWEIMDLYSEDDNFSTFLKRRKEFIPYKYEGSKYVLRRDVVAGAADVNWQTLEQEFPDLADEIKEVKTVTTIGINEEKLKEVLDENPEAMAILNRHLKEKVPSIRISVREKKEEK